jgi:hypothetical protein
MLDYYGSIIKSEKEIDKELVQSFRDRCYESYMKKIISDLRKEGVLQKEYSQSGWCVFHVKTIHEIIEKLINYQKQKNEKKIKLLFCLRNNDDCDIDVIKLICDKL